MVHRLRDDSPSRPKPFNSCPWRFSGSRTCRSPPGTPECTRASTASSRSRARGSSRAGRSRPRRARRAAAPRCRGAPLRGPGRDADEWGQPWIVAPRGRRCRGVRSDDRLSKRAGADIGSWSSNARIGRAAEVRSVTGGGTPRVPVHRQPAAARPRGYAPCGRRCRPSTRDRHRRFEPPSRREPSRRRLPPRGRRHRGRAPRGRTRCTGCFRATDQSIVATRLEQRVDQRLLLNIRSVDDQREVVERHYPSPGLPSCGQRLGARRSRRA